MTCSGSDVSAAKNETLLAECFVCCSLLMREKGAITALLPSERREFLLSRMSERRQLLVQPNHFPHSQIHSEEDSHYGRSLRTCCRLSWTKHRTGNEETRKL